MNKKKVPWIQNNVINELYFLSKSFLPSAFTTTYTYNSCTSIVELKLTLLYFPRYVYFIQISLQSLC